MTRAAKFNLSIFIIITVLILSVAVPASAQDKSKQDSFDIPKGTPLTMAFEAISRVRVYLEFYFMETADYPDSLADLEKEMNSLLPAGLQHLKLPKDPVTGKNFIYSVGKDKKTYTLSVPDPSKYKVKELTFTAVPWGGFRKVAEARKRRFLMTINIQNIQGLTTAIEYFAKDHGGKFPTKLKELIPKYVQSMPVCPISGKLYKYETDGENYSVMNPNPEKYGMKEIMFSSDRGLVVQ